MEETFNKLKNEIKNFEERIEQGDIFIPKEILQIKNLSANEKIYLSCYYMYNKSIQETDEYIKKIITKQGVLYIKRKLYSLNYIKINKKTADELKKETITNSHKGLTCEWCGKECYILQDHHYPISHKKGGKKIVKICPNCHYTFHKLESEIYE